MKRMIAYIIAVCLLFQVSGMCEYYTFSDDAGNSIALREKPESAAVLFSSFTEMWILSGGEVCLTVGESIERGICKTGTPVCDTGAGKRIDLEAIVKIMPDFIIGDADIESHVKARDILEPLGIPFALFRIESIQDYMRVFGIMTDINERNDLYEDARLNVYGKYEAIVEKAGRVTSENQKTVLFIRSGSSYSSAKAKTSDMHFAAKNIADDVPVILDGLSFEEIYQKDPDAIFISLMGNEEASRAYMESVIKEETWQALSAVKNNRVYFLIKDLFQFKPNQRWAIAYEEMAKMLYPEWEMLK